MLSWLRKVSFPLDLIMWQLSWFSLQAMHHLIPVIWHLVYTQAAPRLQHTDMVGESSSSCANLVTVIKFVFYFWMSMHPYTYLCPSTRLPVPVSLRIVNATSTEARVAPGFTVQMYRTTETITVQLYSKITGPSIVCAPQISRKRHCSLNLARIKK